MTLSNFVAYVTQKWKNKPDTSTPLSAERLTHQEDGIKANSDAIQELAAAVVSQIVNNPDKIASMAALYAVDQKVAGLDGKIGDTSKLPAGTTDAVGAIAQLYSNLTDMKPAHYSGISALVGTLTRNSSVISGKMISLAITILSPINSTIAVDTALFRIQGNVVNTIGFVLLGTQTVGYVYAGSYRNGYTDFFIRTALGNPAVTANTEIFIIANIELQ
jgi:hypothetical protein